MLKKSWIFVLIAAILALSSCQVVEVIDHGTTLPPEETTQPIEYSPWGYWYSYDSCSVVELTQDSNKAKIYSLKEGYYAYVTVEEVDCSYDGNTTFTLSTGNESLDFIFDKFANTLKMEKTTYLPKDVAPQKHPEYARPDYTKLDPSSHVTINGIDFSSLAPTVLEGIAYDIALQVYGKIEALPKLSEPLRPAQSGDCVNINYVGKLDGVAFAGGTATNVPLFISDYKNGYIPGFTDGIIGHSVGETFDVNVTFPEDYGATDLAGKAVVFTMTLNSIYDLSLTDKAVEEYKANDYKTYEEWLNSHEQLFDTTKTLLENVIIQASSSTKLPEEAYMYYYQQTIDYYHLVAYYYGFSYEQLMLYSGLSETTVLQQSLNQVVYDMALYALAEENEITWTEDSYTAKYEEYVANYLETQKDATREEACEYADSLLVQIKYELTEDAVIEWAITQIFPPVVE